MKYQILMSAQHKNFFKINALCYTLHPFMLKYLSTCFVTACAGTYSKPFHFALFCVDFTDTFPLYML